MSIGSHHLGTTVLPEAEKDNPHAGVPVVYLQVPENKEVGIFPAPRFWRIRFDMFVGDLPDSFGLDVYDEVILGRNVGTDDTALVDLNRFGFNTSSISRRHLMLRPTPNNLYIIDLGSTNGTLRNGRSIGVNTPYALISGDVITIGDVRFTVQIIDRPGFQTQSFTQDFNLAQALAQIAKAITSQLTLDEVLNQVAETAMSVTGASEAGIWLLDEQSGELFIEAQRGIADERVRRLRLPIREDTLAARVMRTGKPVRANRRPGQEKIKLHTNYLVEAVAQVPITLGGFPFGVLSTTRQDSARSFTDRDVELLQSIADFSAIAIQNARLYEATDEALAKRVQELAAINAVMQAVNSSLDFDDVTAVLTEQIQHHIPVAAVRIFLVDRQQGGVYPLLNAKDVTPMPRRKTWLQGIIGYVAASGATQRINQVAAHEWYDAAIDALNGRPPESLLAAPLLVQEQVVGVLVLYNRNAGRFTQDDETLLQSFAGPVATAVENARLLYEAERQGEAIKMMTGNMAQPILMVDEFGNILIINEAAQQLLDDHMSNLFAAMSGGVGRTSEVTIGEQTFLATTEHLPDMGTILVMQDISYVKKLEHDRSEFIHTLSHDLKNPLTSIMGWTELLIRILPEHDAAQRYANEIVSVSKRMTTMVNDLLKTLAGEESVQLNRKPCRLPEVVDRVVADANGMAMGKMIALETSVNGTPFPIWADSLRLYHMMLNLVDNAIKYSPQKTRIEIGLEFSDSEVLLFVRDEGPGIPEDELTQVFDKYFRSQQTQQESGSGVGLSGVRTIVEAHGGSVLARNRARGGAEFLVKLPASLRLMDEAKVDGDTAVTP